MELERVKVTKNIQKKTVKNLEKYQRKYLFKYFPQSGNFIKTIA